MPVLRELLKSAVEQGASDIHLKIHQEPVFRINGKLLPSGRAPLTESDLSKITAVLIPSHLRERFEQEHEVDFSIEEESVGRFRVNAYRSQSIPVIAFRHVKTEVPAIKDLNLPVIIESLALAPRGIIMASGATGSGKSTTLAAIIRHINENRQVRIITIEDPVEYVFQDNRSLISQREVGLDTQSFRSALKNVLRQDPDVIMVGEMRDQESFIAALSAAETGHLVLTTLHTDSAASSVARILDFFPAHERDQMRMAIASNLHAVLCQRLIPGVQSNVMPAVEIMINTPTVRKLIEKNQLEKLSAAIETGTEDGMQSFNQSIYTLIKSGAISEAEGLHHASNAETLKMKLKGIFIDEERRILQ